ncbi:MAG TPA: ribonuclease H-like domain-containing protein [Acidobacteriota bacterium]|nr:ribonuclease H-like domain-containing protein [Acidobacteriota bacterium]
MRNLVFDFSGGQDQPLVLDVETQYLTEQVAGGWDAVDKLKVALVVTWDEKNSMRTWYEEDVPRLLMELRNFQPIVTFNGDNFDFKVLGAYGPVDFLKGKSTDMLAIMSRKLGFRVKLESVAQATLGRGKTASGKDSVDWWQSGDPEKRRLVAEYCAKDVELTRDLYLFGKEKGFVSIDDAKQGGTRRVEVSW